MERSTAMPWAFAAIACLALAALAMPAAADSTPLSVAASFGGSNAPTSTDATGHAGAGTTPDVQVAAPSLPDLPVPDLPALPEVPDLTDPLRGDAADASPNPEPAAPASAHAALPPAAVAVPVAGVGAGVGLLVAFKLWPAGTRRILGTLARLVGLGGGVGLFSRIGGDDVLQHPTRQQLLDAITASPGMTMQDAQRRLGIAWGTLVHHLRLLERHGAVVSVRQGPRRLLYAASSPEARARGDLAVLRTETAQRIAITVTERPGIQQVDLCDRLGLRAPAASKHLGRLERVGLVEVQRDGGRATYQPTEKLATALALAAPVVRVTPVAKVPAPLARPLATTHAPRPPRPKASAGSGPRRHAPALEAGLLEGLAGTTGPTPIPASA